MKPSQLRWRLVALSLIGLSGCGDAGALTDDLNVTSAVPMSDEATAVKKAIC